MFSVVYLFKTLLQLALFHCNTTCAYWGKKFCNGAKVVAEPDKTLNSMRTLLAQIKAYDNGPQKFTHVALPFTDNGIKVL